METVSHIGIASENFCRGDSYMYFLEFLWKELARNVSRNQSIKNGIFKQNFLNLQFWRRRASRLRQCRKVPSYGDYTNILWGLYRYMPRGAF